MIKIALRNAVNFFRSHRLVAIVFFLSLVFFIWQHSTGISWDFSVYSMNGKYMIGSGSYFEWVRPPLPSFLLGIFSFLTPFSGYAYIILVSALFLYSCVSFSRSFRLDETSYYVFSMSVFTLALGFLAGSELLSLSLLHLSLALLRSPAKSGFLSGLSILARYSNAPYLVLLAKKNSVKVIIAIAAAAAIFIPWLAYSYAKTGNPLASFLDYYLLDVNFRSLVVQSPQAWHFIFAANLCLPFFVLGISKMKGFSKKQDVRIIAAFTAITLLLYFASPFKEARYLFPLVLTMAYFSTLSLNKKTARLVLPAFDIATAVLVLALLPSVSLEKPYLYRSLAVGSNCSVLSNEWVPIAYEGASADTTMYSEIPMDAQNLSVIKDKENHTIVKTDLQKKIDQGYRLILFNITDDKLFNESGRVSSAYVLYKSEFYVILGDKTKCRQPGVEDSTFVSKLNETFYENYGSELRCSFLGCSISR